MSSGCNSITAIQIFYRVSGDAAWIVEHVENPVTQQEVIIRLQGQGTIEAKALFINNANLSFETGVMILEGQ